MCFEHKSRACLFYQYSQPGIIDKEWNINKQPTIFSYLLPWIEIYRHTVSCRHAVPEPSFWADARKSRRAEESKIVRCFDYGLCLRSTGHKRTLNSCLSYIYYSIIESKKQAVSIAHETSCVSPQKFRSIRVAYTENREKGVVSCHAFFFFARDLQNSLFLCRKTYIPKFWNDLNFTVSVGVDQSVDPHAVLA